MLSRAEYLWVGGGGREWVKHITTTDRPPSMLQSIHHPLVRIAHIRIKSPFPIVLLLSLDGMDEGERMNERTITNDARNE